MQEPKYLSKLEKGRHAQGITVRVVRKWTHYENTAQATPLYVGMVLADAKGHNMYAKISDDLIEGKACLFDVGKVYIIKKYLVKNAKKSYRAVDRNLMIELTDHTTAEVVRNPPQTIPQYVYKLTSFPAIKAAKYVYNYTDVLGYLIKFEAAHTFVPKNTEKAKTLREIYIKDIRENVMKITLWGEQAANFSIDKVYNNETGNIVVCLIVGCIPREDFKNKDKISLSGSPACFCYFNPEIPEAQAFYSRFRKTPIYIDRPAEEDILNEVQDIQLPEKTIEQLHDVDPFDDQETGPFKCTVTISSIVNTTNWWYMACKICKKKAEQQMNGTYKCPICHGTNTAPRYLLSFIGKDGTGEARFFAYDDEDAKIIQKECEAIINPLYAKEGLPQPMQNIINKTFVLLVNLTNESCRKIQYKQYQVKAVLERPARHAAGQPGPIQQHESLQLEASHAVGTSSQKETELLQIQAPGQFTPTSTFEPEHEAGKSSGSSSPKKQTGVRKALFIDDNITDEETKESDETDAADNVTKTQTETSPSLQPKTKKAKSGKHKEDECAPQT